MGFYKRANLPKPPARAMKTLKPAKGSNTKKAQKKAQRQAEDASSTLKIDAKQAANAAHEADVAAKQAAEKKLQVRMSTPLLNNAYQVI